MSRRSSPFSLKRRGRTRQQRKECAQKKFLMESLEQRMLLAVGPELVAISPNQGELLQDGDVRHVAPRELTFIFNDGQSIDPDSLSTGIIVERSGGDGTFDDDNEFLVTPGFIGVNPDDTNQVTLRFAETLPDDRYRITLVGTGTAPLENSLGQAFHCEEDLVTEFELDLGAQIRAIVPQPVSWGVGGVLQQARNQIEVYFNDDDLDPATAEDKRFYKLILTQDTVDNLDDDVFEPTSVTYDPATDKAVLTFGMDLDALGGPGTYRLRIGTDEANPPAPEFPTDTTPVTTDLNTGGPLEIRLSSNFSAASDVEVFVSKADLGLGDPVDAFAFGTRLNLVLNTNALNPATPQAFVDAINGVTGLITAEIVTDDPAADIITPAINYSPLVVAVPGNTFNTARDLGVLGATSQIVQSAIDAVPFPLDFPGADDEPGHRDINVAEAQTHFLGVPADSDPADFDQGDTASGPTVFPYNFQTFYGVDPVTNAPLPNFITENQKDRAREIFEIYSNLLGIDVIETEQDGLTIVTGDLRVFEGRESGPGGVVGVAGTTNSGVRAAVMDNAETWSDEFLSLGGAGRQSWFGVAMHEIGHLIGLGHTHELPPLTVMGDEPELAFANLDEAMMGDEPQLAFVSSVEAIFPGDNDVVHGRHLHRPDSNDVDLYRVEIPAGSAGLFTGEIVAERLDNSSLLDSNLTVYQEIDDGGMLTREKIAQNDDYFSEDSFIELDLEPGVYFIGVSSTGNDQYDPNVEDSGIGGTSRGDYDLRLNFRADVNQAIMDLPPDSLSGLTEPQALDGDADGRAGGVFNFWFRVAAPSGLETAGDPRTIFVDKSHTANGGPQGTLENPFTNIHDALGLDIFGNPTATPNPDAAQPGDVVRVIGNGDVSDLTSILPYEIGRDGFNDPLPDGVMLDLPQGVTMMVDAGVVFKLRGSAGIIGSSATGVDHSGSALQVLGTPEANVYFTAFSDSSIGVDNDPLDIPPIKGEWGGLLFINEIDRAEGRLDREDSGIFLNYVNQADIRYGGGGVNVGSITQVITPIDLRESRTTVSYNSITLGASAAISATPDTFEETNFHAPVFQATPFTSDYDRVGPDVQGNRLLGNSFNGLFVRIDTPAADSLRELTVSGRWDDEDVVHVVSQNLVIASSPGGPISGELAMPPGSSFDLVAREDARLAVDPGVIVKLDGARIETEVGAQFIAEGRDGQETVFTSILNDEYGASGTFDTTDNQSLLSPAPGDWGGVFVGHSASASVDRAVFSYGGGITALESNFSGFNVFEIHQAEARIANSVFEHNAVGTGGAASVTRFGRGQNGPGAIFVRGSQPIIVNNIIRTTSAAAININVNALNSVLLPDYGRTTGRLDRHEDQADNQGPLIDGNRLEANSINGMLVRPGTLTTQGVWDDTNIVHVLQGTVYVPDFHTSGGLRLESRPSESLVVKLKDPVPLDEPDEDEDPIRAGFAATGRPLDIDDRIGGSIQIVGQPGRPVVLTSLDDDTVGAGQDVAGNPQFDTNNNQGATEPVAGDWNTILLDTYSHDRNVDVLTETEGADQTDPEANSNPADAQLIGQLAQGEKSSDDNLRLGFEVHGTIRNLEDVDVYSFTARGGTEVWFDIDRTSSSLDTVLELVDVNGVVLASSNDSFDDLVGGTAADDLVAGTTTPRPMAKLDTSGKDHFTVNPKDSGMRLNLPGASTITGTHYIRVRGQQSTGTYQLQVRIRETDEIPGSVVKFADIRYATNGVQVVGQPIHSPLIGNVTEQGDASNEFDNAQPIGNVLTTDRASIRIAGNLSGTDDVDWYTFDVIHDSTQSGGGNTGIIFDIDYADRAARPNTSIYLFNDSGTLIYAGEFSNVADDQPAPLQGPDTDDLSRGSFGTLDPFLGTVSLPNGTYYVAVSHDGMRPSDLVNQSSTGDPANPGVRIEPLASINRIGDDSLDAVPNETTGGPPFEQPQQELLIGTLGPDGMTTTLDKNIVPFNIGDVVLYISREGGDVFTMDPFVAGQETLVRGADDSPWRDIAMRPDRHLFTINPGITDEIAGEIIEIDWSDGSLEGRGDDGITLYNLAVGDMGADPMAEPVATDSGILYEGLTFGPADDLLSLYVVGNRSDLLDPPPDGEEIPGLMESENVVWSLDAQTFAANGDPRDLEMQANILLTSGSDFIEVGQMAPAGTLVTGLALASPTELFGVTDTGELYVMDPTVPGPGTMVASLPDAPVFQGLTMGPPNVENGRFEQVLFAVDDVGTLYAFDTTGTPVPAFVDGTETLALFGEDGSDVPLTGLAFSTLDENLWTGGGVLTFSDIDQPGGAYGSVVTNSFDLTDYAPEDEPHVYFDYSLDADEGVDAFRVYAAYNSADPENGSPVPGPWHLIATSLDGVAVGRGDLNNQVVQQLHNSAGGMRQARIPLTSMAGKSGVRLRFEFSTASALDIGATGGIELRAKSAVQLLDTETFNVDDGVYEFDKGPTLVLPSASGIVDGQTLTVDIGGTMETFEFDTEGTFEAANTVIPVLSTDNAETIAFKLKRGLETSTLPKRFTVIVPDVSFINEGDTIFINDIPFEMDIDGEPADPEADPPAVLITFDPEMDTAESIATLLADAISMNVMDSMVVQRGLNSDQLIITGADKVEIVGQSSLRLFGSTHQTNNRVNLEHDAGTTFTQTVPGDVPSAVFAEGADGVLAEMGIVVKIADWMSAEQVADEIHLILAENLAGGLNEAIKRHDSETIFVHEHAVTAGVLTVFDTLTTTSNFYSNARAQNNAGAGVTVDNIIIGFAERGEQVFGASENPEFVANPAALAGQIAQGDYLLEIRRAAEFEGFRSFDTNERLSQSATLRFQPGSEIQPGQRFTLSDSIDVIDFEFVDRTIYESNGSLVDRVDSGLVGGTVDTYIGIGAIGDNLTFDRGLDIDLISIDLLAGDFIEVDVESLLNKGTLTGAVPAIATTHLRLFDATDAEVVSSATGTLSAFALEDTTVTLGISGEGNTAYDLMAPEDAGPSASFGEYQVKININGGETPSTEPILVGFATFDTAARVADRVADIINSVTGAEAGLDMTAATNSGTNLVDLFGGSVVTGAPIFQITPTTDANQLRDAVIGDGITSVGNAIFTGSDTSAGIFNGGGSALGLESGIVLTTGDVGFADAANTADDSGGDASGAGDEDLDAAMALETMTSDATVLEFTFKTETSDLYFNFIFASEEFNELANDADNDVVGFLVDGTNIALMPGTLDPVSSNIVNGGSLFGANAQNPILFNNNGPTDGGAFLRNFGYDGFTDVLTAVVTDLTPGLHTLKLVISDVANSVDSAVFIEARGLRSTPAPVNVTNRLQFDEIGDRNQFFDQGQLIIHSNRIFDAAEYGINIGPAERDASDGNLPHPGSVTNLREPNVEGLVPSVTVTNNLLVRGGMGGVLFAGDDNSVGPEASVPYGRIINNTVVGEDMTGIGVEVVNNASPTLLNNVFANLNIGISIDATSNSTVIGGSLFQGNDTIGSSGGDAIFLAEGEPLFVNARTDNYFPASGSPVIDSSVDSLGDRPNLVTVKNPLGIALSPVLSPDFDVTGQLRVDDPNVPTPLGQGGNVFKDRGALDRSDFIGPTAVLATPRDNDSDGLDQNPNTTFIDLIGETLSEFVVTFPDSASTAGTQQGTGVDAATVSSDTVALLRDSVLLQPGLDYTFSFNSTNGDMRLTPLAGLWVSGSYSIILDNTTIADMTGNLLSANRPSGDTAFNINLNSEALLDFGDAPDPTYPTLLASDGARHLVVAGIMLGGSVNSEADGLQNPAADGDTGDDGVTFDSPLSVGSNVQMTVTASSPGQLDGWIDFNGDGNWDDPGEQIFTDEPLVAGDNVFSRLIDPAAVAGDTYARFRYSTAGGLSPTGFANDGEVEDYLVTLIAPELDFGDAPDFTYFTTLANNGARHVIVPGFHLGATVDAEPDGQPNGFANGDGSDEDGVTFVSPLQKGETASIVVNASASGQLDAWFDFDASGDFDDTALSTERIFTSEPIFAGDNPLTFEIPATAVVGTSYLRFRFSSAGGLSPMDTIAPAPDGEVEDYQRQIAQPGFDYGDAPDPTYPTLLASDGARHITDGIHFLGLAVDDELNGQPNASANGDSGDDGVVFISGLAANETASVTVTASVDGMLNAWIDFDGNGIWEATEKIFDDQAVTAGVNDNLTFTVNASAVAGETYARFRFSDQSIALPTGEAANGEVEDYLVTVRELDFGDADFNEYPTLRAQDGARHGVDATFHLGATIDAEADGTLAPDEDASDDGITLPAIAYIGESIEIIADVSLANEGVLDAWIDFNGDGVWDDPFGTSDDAERILSGFALDATSNSISITLPTDSITAGNVFARFRLSRAGTESATGFAADGEVEDYEIEIVGVDFGDAPDEYPVNRADDGARHGIRETFLGTGNPSGKPDGQPSSGADLDADDDGVTLTASGLTLQGASIAVEDTVSITVASAGTTAGGPTLLDAWVDFNGDGDWDDLNEQIFTSESLTAASTDLSFVVPADGRVGTSYARFRVSTAGGLAPNGFAETGEVEDYQLTITGPPIDFGDAPDPTYPTLLSSDGARHFIEVGFNLGAEVDAEDDGQPNGFADGDDIAPASGTNDEDGVVFTGLLQPGSTFSADVTVKDDNGGDKFLDGWIDFNQNGIFGDAPDEHVISSEAVVVGPNSLPITTPLDAEPGATFARFRLSRQTDLGPSGIATEGEVEDYLVEFATPLFDYGDADDDAIVPRYPTLLVNAGARHILQPNFTLGLGVTDELDGQPSAGADADNDDGVQFVDPLEPLIIATITVLAPTSSPLESRLDAWIDWNADGDWDDADEQIATNELLAAGSNNLTVTVPGFARAGSTVARFRLSSMGNLAPSGTAADGEVEDYLVTIVDPGTDYGDAPDPYPTLNASNPGDGAARHILTNTLFLGLDVDAEADGQPLPTALGDNHDDGVVIGELTMRSDELIVVSASESGLLDAWIDWNSDGDWEDANEQIFSSEPLDAGTNSFTLTVSDSRDDLVAGATFARFRVSTAGGLAPFGAAVDGEVEDYQVTIIDPGLDFGDASDPPYPTLLANEGARHLIVDGISLGATVTGEDDGQPSTNANADSDDGVTIPAALIKLATESIVVNASTDGQLDAWIDFNGNGNWNDPGDQIFANHILTPGDNSLDVTIPSQAVGGATTARFRFSSGGGLSPTELADDGEVEDYLVNIVDLGADFGDALDPPYPTLLANDGARHTILKGFFLGANVDGEIDGQPSTGASADIDDGVTFPSELTVRTTETITVNASQAGLLDAWIDYDGDGIWSAGEQIFASESLMAGDNDLVIPIPTGAVDETTTARFRFSSAGGLSPTGLANDGEVEDYLVSIEDPGSDFGDAPDPTFPTLLSNDGARHLIVEGFSLGASVDGEIDGQPSAGATGDESDEAGVTFPAPLVARTDVDIIVNASQAGLLDAWVDFNQDGDWNDANEQIFNSQNVSAGDNTLTVSVPDGSVDGLAIARFRLSSTGGLATTGEASSGEVEDYQVSVVDPGLDFGDAPDPTYPTLLASDGARHKIVPGIFLGLTIDEEPNGQPSAFSNADGDDEDGVILSGVLAIGGATDITVTASVAGVLDAWLDLDGDGVWDTANEQIVTGQTLVAGENDLSLTVPSDATEGASHVRFRFSIAGGLAPTGIAEDGEVEDYRVTLVPSSGGWHNTAFPTDVNNLDGPTPFDALLIINELDVPTVSDPVTGVLDLPASPPPFYDVNNDGFVSPFDALLVINAIPVSNPPLSAMSTVLLADAIAPSSLENHPRQSEPTVGREIAPLAHDSDAEDEATIVVGIGTTPMVPASLFPHDVGSDVRSIDLIFGDIEETEEPADVLTTDLVANSSDTDELDDVFAGW
jgi:hypothetical protein